MLTGCLFIHLICQFPQENAKKQYLCVHWQNNSTASLKNSTDVSAHFSNYGYEDLPFTSNC